MNVSVVGLGKLGACLAAILADAGNRVYGVDTNTSSVDAINKGSAPVEEVGLQAMLDGLKPGMLTATTQYSEAIPNTDVTMIVVPTPSGLDDQFVNTFVLEAIENIGRNLPDHWHTVVVCSTIMPGASDGEIIPALEAASDRKVGDTVGYVYNPEFIALGSVIKDMLHPDVVLIGTQDNRSEINLMALVQTYAKGFPNFVTLRHAEAELAKISLNTYVTMKISFANTIAEIAEKMNGANGTRILEAVGQDTRVGGKYLKPGAAFGGVCLLPETLVITKEGLKRIDSMSEGDEVIGHDGFWHKVTQVMARPYAGIVHSVTVRGKGGQTITATPEHPVWGFRGRPAGRTHYETTIRGERKLRLTAFSPEVEKLGFYPVADIRVGDCVGFPNPAWTVAPPEITLTPSRNYWLTKVPGKFELTPDVCRYVGLFLAEGSTWHKEIRFSFHQNEREYVADVIDLSKRLWNGSAKEKPRKDSKGTDVVLYCTSLAEWLRNTCGTGASNKHIPLEWVGLPRENLVQLVQGMWSGDGSISDGVFTWASTSRQLWTFMKLALMRLGIVCTSHVAKEHTGADGVFHAEAYFVKVSNPSQFDKMNQITDSLMQLPPPSRPARRTILDLPEGEFGPVVKLTTSTYVGPVWNLEVEGAESYTLESGTVHNCFPRDNRAFFAFAESLNVDAPLAMATDDVNRRVTYRTTYLLRGFKTVAVLGLAYKPNTPIFEESMGLTVARSLAYADVEVRAHDPQARPDLPMGATQYETVEEALEGTEAVLVATPWKAYSTLDFEGRKVLDMWGCTTPQANRRVIGEHCWWWTP